MSPPDLKFVGVRKVFGAAREPVVAVDRFDAELHPGEVLAVVGPSGCGKSTLLGLAAGFLEPTEGSVEVRGARVRGVRTDCGVIFQSYALFPWRTVRRNIEFALQMRGAGRRRRVERAGELTALVGLRGFEDAYPAALSGGMQQRVALARTLANDPTVLLMDEPFAALDAMTRELMQQELARLVSAQGMSTMLITHSIDEALFMADRVLVMSRRPGRIMTVVENRLPRPRTPECMTDPEFARLRATIWEVVRGEVMPDTVQLAPTAKRPAD